MKKILFLICFTICASFAFAQTDYEVITVDVLVPPSKTIDFANKEIAIVAVHYRDKITDNIKKQIQKADSIVLLKLANNVKEWFEASPVFENIDIPIYNIYGEKKESGKVLGEAELSDLSNDSGADIILAVNELNFSVQNNQAKLDKFLNPQNVLEVAFFVHLSIYNVASNTVIDDLLLRDTANYLSINADLNKEIAAAVDETISLIGESFAQRIVPYWERVERICYVNSLNKLSRKALKHAEANEWNEAIEVWTELLSSDKKSNASHAMFNLALGCEMLAKFDLAKKWLEACEENFPNRLETQAYKKIIEQRIADAEKLKTAF